MTGVISALPVNHRVGGSLENLILKISSRVNDRRCLWGKLLSSMISNRPWLGTVLNVTFLSLLFFKHTVPLPHCTWGYYLETDPDPIAMVIRVELFTHMPSETNINWHCMGYSCTTMLQVSSVCWACGWIAWLYLPWWQFGLGWFWDNTPRRAPECA